ncbi:MAG: hypothetical protein H0T79_24280 [Deltaproteobacteria bacterium]|nr:hypothetical protein [Deltaproteobacteria bacterium]
MKHLLIAALAGSLVLASVEPSRAEPTTIAVTGDASELDQLVRTARARAEEPTGLEVDNRSPLLARFKLAPGDLIRTVNGSPALGRVFLMERTGVVYLDVLRGKQALVVRVAFKVAPTQQATIHPFELEQNLAASRVQDNFAVVTRAGKASGVVIVAPWYGSFERVDVLRAIDGAAVTTVEAVAQALEKIKPGASVVVKLDRSEQPVALKLTLYVPTPDTAADELQVKIDKGITKIDETHYTIARSLVDEILANPMAVAKGARVVPSIKEGKANGFKLYAIRPSSVYAKLGLANGDTLTKINSFELTSADKALEVYTQLRDAKSLVLEIQRRGKPITLTYTIR